MDLLALADFSLVASHGGFGRASRASGRPKATLSRRVTELEQGLGLRLIERNARGLRLTEEGASLHARVEGLLGELAEAGEAVAAGPRPRGRLRVSAPVMLTHVSLGRIAAEFLDAYPEVRLDIVAEDRIVEPVEEGYDLVIRVNPRPDDALVGRCIIHDRLLVVAAPSVKRPEGEDGRVPGVVRTTTPEDVRWHVRGDGFEATIRPDPVLRISSLLAARDAVIAGVGAAVLPRSLVRNDLSENRLVCWGELPGRGVEVWALHVSRRLVTGKVSAFMRHLTAAFTNDVLPMGTSYEHLAEVERPG